MAKERKSASGYTGVEIQGDKVRIRVPFEGGWVRESTESPPTPKGLKEAARQRQEIIDRTKLGVIDWAQYFPNSTRADQHYEDVPTFAEYSEKYLNYCEAVDGKSPSTIVGYRKRLNGIWCPAFGGTDIDLIKRSHIRDVLAKQTWKGKTMANAISPLKGVFALAIENEFIQSNPADGIKVPRSQKEAPDPLSREEMLTVLDAIPQYWKPYFQVAFGTGLRPSELIALKWSAVKLKPRKLFITEARVLGQDKSTKTYETRTVPISPLALSGFAVQRNASFEHSTYVFLKPNTHDPLDNEQTQRRIWNAAIELAEVKHRKAYSTRHTFATLLLMAGEPMERVSTWMGHETPAMTYRHYARWIESEDGRLSPLAMKALGK